MGKHSHKKAEPCSVEAERGLKKISKKKRKDERISRKLREDLDSRDMIATDLMKACRLGRYKKVRFLVEVNNKKHDINYSSFRALRF